MGWFLSYCSASGNFMSLNQLKTILFIIVLGFSIIKSTKSFADTYTPPVKYELAQVPPAFSDNPRFDSASAACASQLARYRTAQPSTQYELIGCDSQPNTSTLYFRLKTTSPTGTVTYSSTNGSIAGAKLQTCATGYTLSGNIPNASCTGSCASPLVYNSVTNSCQPEGACTPPNVFNQTTQSCSPQACLSKKGVLTTYQLNYGTSTTTTNTGADICQQSCTVVPLLGHCGFNAQKTNYACLMQGVFDGTTCAGADTASSPPPDPANDCIKQGKSYGTVNGVVVCTAKGTTGSEPIKTVQKDTKKTTNSDGTTESKTTSREDDGLDIKETTVTKNADGTESTETKQQSKSSFCEENPNSKTCKQGNEICTSDPDSPQCKHFCQKYPDTISCKTPTELIGDSSTLNQDNSTVTERNLPSTIANISLPQANSCPPDYSVSIGGRTIPFSYSWLCQYASSFKPLVIAVSLLSAALLVFGSIRQQGS